MKCPKCKEEIIDGIKFCTKCGVNIEEEKKRIADEEAKKLEEAEKKRKAAEDKKRLDEIRKQEALKKEKEIKEAEKQAAILQAKEEGIELEIIDEEPKKEEINTDNTSDFKVKKQENVKNKQEKKKKQKVKLKKNIFQRILNKIIFMLIVAAIIIGGVYYAYKEEKLPDFAQKEVEEFESKLKNVIELYKEVKENEKNTSKQNENNGEKWYVEPTIEATDIKDLTKEVSVIVKDEKEGLIDNNTGKIVVEPIYTQILYTEYYDLDKTENEKESGIIVQEGDKFFKLSKDYQKQDEVRTIAKKDEGTYFYDHHGNDIYYNSADQKCTKVEKDSNKSGLKVCTDIDIVTTEGVPATSIKMPENFSIDFSKSKITTKGYFDLATGKLKINCDYDEAYEFSEGYAVVEKEKTYSNSVSQIYDSDGNEILPLNSKQTLAGIIDENGKEVIEAKYEKARSVHNGKTFIMKNGKWGILEIK